MDKGINLHKELAMGLPSAQREATGKKVPMEKQGGSVSKANLKCGGKVKAKKKEKK